MSFKNLMLSQKLQDNIKAVGYIEPTPIQKEAIPALREGRDILAISQTGTGKTASFVLPMLDNIPQREDKRVGDDRYKIDALILAPTRELVIQIHNSIKSYSIGFRHKSVALYGGVKLGSQVKEIRAGANIAVATPARVLEHIKNRTLNLSNIQMLVIDEADRLLEMGFIDDTKAIISKLPTKRQSAMFSATFSKPIKSLAKSLLKNPITIEIKGGISAKEIKQSAYYINEEQKIPFLISLLKKKGAKQTLIFVNTKRWADILAGRLKLEGINVTSIHGDRSQNIRNQALDSFKNREIDILIATDVVARGVDIKALPLVINFELPTKNEEYIHRIGRTGRAKESGEAISLVSNSEIEQFYEIEKALDITIPAIKTEGFIHKKRKCSKKSDKKEDKLKKAKELAQKMMEMSSNSKKKRAKSPKNRKYF